MNDVTRRWPETTLALAPRPTTARELQVRDERTAKAIAAYLSASAPVASPSRTRL